MGHSCCRQGGKGHPVDGGADEEEVDACFLLVVGLELLERVEGGLVVFATEHCSREVDEEDVFVDFYWSGWSCVRERGGRGEKRRGEVR